ncbi:MAG: 23S rRNA (uracil(1939)-C(5))-methyltransferase RlmD, partial [Candidatus Gastranaerophilaceae bacterium]
VISTKKNYAKAKVVEIIAPSPHRTKPFCNLAKVCGGCGWQHITYEHQLEAKRKIVEETVKKISGLDVEVKNVIPSPEIKEYRCKIQLPARQTKVSKRFLSGYFKKGSHEIVNIKFCPIQPQIINEITEFIKEKAQILGLSAYDEKKHSGTLRHIVFRYSATFKNILLIFVINETAISKEIEALAKEVQVKYSCITGIVANFNTLKNNIILGAKFEIIYGKDYIEEELKGRKYKISAGSFFQVNPLSAINIFETVEKIIKDNFETPKILDPYSGVGSFSIWLKDLASEIIAVEEYSQAVFDAKENLIFNDANNITLLEGDAENIIDEMADKSELFDAVIIDPPRKGCSEKALEGIAKLAKGLIVYISCNPATMARDIKFLHQKGFMPEYIQPVDMFCHSYHIESVVVLKNRNN